MALPCPADEPRHGRGQDIAADASPGRVAAMDRVEALLRRDTRFAGDTVTRPHALIVAVWRVPVSPNGRTQEGIGVVFAPGTVWDLARNLLLAPFSDRLANGKALLVLVGHPSSPELDDAVNLGVASVVSPDPCGEDLHLAAHRAFELLETKARAETRGQSLRRYRFELGELVDIAQAMTTVRDVDKLLDVILEKSRFITGADAGSIYIVERPSRGAPDLVLRFKLTQNDSVSFDSREFTMPLNDRSMAGSAALNKTTLNIPDVYALAAGSTFNFDPSFDRRTGYLTRSMLVAPLISQRDEVIGVIQLINKKRERAHALHTPSDVRQHVVAFDERSQELLGMLAAQAGVSSKPRSSTGHPYDVRRVREGQRRGDRVARSDHQRSLAARRGADGVAGKGGRHRDEWTVRRRILSRRGPARARVRKLAARFWQDRGAREGPREGQEAL